MKKREIENMEIVKNVIDLLENARKKVVTTVNQTMVLTYFEIGRMIVEEEQKGENRAEYGKKILDLKSENIKIKTVILSPLNFKVKKLLKVFL